MFHHEVYMSSETWAPKNTNEANTKIDLLQLRVFCIFLEYVIFFDICMLWGMFVASSFAWFFRLHCFPHFFTGFCLFAFSSLHFFALVCSGCIFCHFFQVRVFWNKQYSFRCKWLGYVTRFGCGWCSPGMGEQSLWHSRVRCAAVCDFDGLRFILLRHLWHIGSWWQVPCRIVTADCIPGAVWRCP